VVDGREPGGQRQLGVLEHGAGGQPHLPLAPAALEQLAGRQLAEAPVRNLLLSLKSEVDWLDAHNVFILEISKIDPNGISFRYHFDLRSGAPTLVDEIDGKEYTHLALDHLEQKMKEVFEAFDRARFEIECEIEIDEYNSQ
jgi:hypothetical protein